MDLTYLACPYTDEDVGVRHWRFRRAVEKAANMMLTGERVFSPIVHGHAIDLQFSSPQSGTFWKHQDEFYLQHCTKMVVLMLEGWRESTGVQYEISVITNRGVPIHYEEN